MRHPGNGGRASERRDREQSRRRRETMRAASPPIPTPTLGSPSLLGREAQAKKHPPRLRTLRHDGRTFLGVQQEGRVLAKKIKAHSLTGRITPDVMASAFRNVKRNRGAAGID